VLRSGGIVIVFQQEIFVLIWLILYLQNRSTLHDVGCMYEHSVDGRGRSSW
jgi:hypothetical protein